MNAWRWTMVGICVVAAAAGVVLGHWVAAAAFGGAALSGSVHRFWRPAEDPRSRADVGGLKVSICAYNLVLTGAVLLSIGGAVFGSGEHRGGFVGVAILLGAMELGLALLSVAMLRRMTAMKDPS